MAEYILSAIVRSVERLLSHRTAACGRWRLPVLKLPLSLEFERWQVY